ncbi:MAG: Fe-S cluster assembly sulfur transfer protein SufU [Cellulomonas sp.]
MSTGEMEQLYQQVILDHARAPHGRGLEPLGLVAGESHQVNTTCGDEVTLRIELDDAGRRTVRSMSWDGQGCSISQASLSVLHDLVVGADLAEVERLGGTFRALMNARGLGLDDDAEELLGDATAFTGVAKFPARIKCALLGWAALTDALIKTGAMSPGTPQEDA